MHYEHMTVEVREARGTQPHTVLDKVNGVQVREMIHLSDFLVAKGAEGWEVVAAFSHKTDSSGHTIILKRVAGVM